MNLSNLFLLQSELDQHIEEQHPRMEGESRHKEKVLALLVEIGELANETRCFKFWSNKPASEKSVILEEFSDGIHFFLSLGLEMKVEKLEYIPWKKGDLVQMFIGLYNAISVLAIRFTDITYSAAFSAYIDLGTMLGFSWEDIEAGYLAKNEKNHKRQEESY